MMKPLEENRTPHNSIKTEKSPKKSFLRSLLRKKSTSTSSTKEQKNKDDKRLDNESEISKPQMENRSYSQAKNIRDRSLNVTSLERQDQRDTLVEDTRKSFGDRSQGEGSRRQTKKISSQVQGKAVTSSSRPIHWVVPDHVNENIDPHKMTSINGEKRFRQKTDEAKIGKHVRTTKPHKTETETVDMKSTIRPIHPFPEQASHVKDKQSETKNTGKKNPDVNYRSSSQRSTSAAVNPKSIRPRKKSLTVETPIRRRNRKLIHLVVELRKSCDLYRREIKRIKDEEMGEIMQLQRENESLNLELYQLNQQVEEWKTKCRKQENQNVSLVKVKNLTKKTNELTEDIEVLKSVIHRLNKEMSFYQDKLKIQYEYLPNQPAYSTSSSSCSRKETKEWDEVQTNEEETKDEILKEPKKKLFPLLIAYDEVIKEKNEIVKNHEVALERFKSKCQEVVQENQDLHELIAEKKEKGMVSIQEWEFLHTNSVIVLEENDLLNEKLSVMKQKESSMLNIHQEKLSKLKTKISILEEEKLQLKSAAIKTETNCKMLMDQHARLAEIIEKRIPVEQHEASVLECKKLFEELRISYGDERAVLMEKLSAAEKERDRLALELAELEAENGRIQSNIKTCEDALAVNALQFREVYNRLIVATNARDTSASAMEEMMELSQRVVSERENTEQLLDEQRSLNEKLILLRERECELIAELHTKIKAMEDIHQNELEKLIFRIKELEKMIGGIGESHKQEMSHLETLIQEKEKRIHHLESEKGQLQLDLETVWKTTTCTIKDLKNKSSSHHVQEE